LPDERQPVFGLVELLKSALYFRDEVLGRLGAASFRVVRSDGTTGAKKLISVVSARLRAGQCLRDARGSTGIRGQSLEQFITVGSHSKVLRWMWMVTIAIAIRAQT
jgi:hypothetical protein